MNDIGLNTYYQIFTTDSIIAKQVEILTKKQSSIVI